MINIQKILLAVMLIIVMGASLSADEIVGTWVYDKKTSVSHEKNEDLKMILGTAKAKNIIFAKNGKYGDNTALRGKWEKTGSSSYEVRVPNDPIIKARIEKDYLIMVADMEGWGIWVMYYKKSKSHMR